MAHLHDREMSSTSTMAADADISTEALLQFADIQKLQPGRDRIEFLSRFGQKVNLRSIFVHFDVLGVAALEEEHKKNWGEFQKWLGAAGLYGEFNELLLSWTVLHVAAYLMDIELIEFLVNWDNDPKNRHAEDVETGGGPAGRRGSRAASSRRRSSGEVSDINARKEVDLIGNDSLIVTQDSQGRIPLDIAYYRYTDKTASYELFALLTPREKLSSEMVKDFAEEAARTAKYQVIKFSVLQFVGIAELFVYTTSWAVKGMIIIVAAVLLAVILDKSLFSIPLGKNDSFTSLPTWNATSTNLLAVIAAVKFLFFGESFDYSLMFLGIGMIMEDTTGLFEATFEVVILYGRRRLVPVLANHDAKRANVAGQGDVLAASIRTTAMSPAGGGGGGEKDDFMQNCMQNYANRRTLYRVLTFPTVVVSVIGMVLSAVYYWPAKVVRKILFRQEYRVKRVDDILKFYEDEQPDKILAHEKLKAVADLWFVVLLSDIVFTGLVAWFAAYSQQPIGGVAQTPLIDPQFTFTPTSH